LRHLEPLPYYKWLVRDYRANRKVQRMSYIAKGLYRELLDEAWLEGSIPNDIENLADICGCPASVMAKAWKEIAGCFDDVGDGYLVNAKLESMRTELDAKRVSLGANGRKGAIAKLRNMREKQVSDQQTLASSDNCHTRDSNCHIEEAETKKSERRKERDPCSPRSASDTPNIDPDVAIYEAYPRKVGRRAALKAIAASVDRLSHGEGSISPMTRVEARKHLWKCATTFAKSPAGRRGEFTPHPATWFNQSRYLDADAEWQTGGKDGTNRNNYESPAIARRKRSNDAIRAAAEKYGLASNPDAHGADERQLSGPGVAGGHTGDVDTDVGGIGAGVRIIDLQRGA
jgi:hypothetical protein